MTEEQNTSTPESPENAPEEVLEAQEGVSTPEEPAGLQTKIKVPLDKLDRAFGSLRRQTKSFEEKRAEDKASRETFRGDIEADVIRQAKLDPIAFMAEKLGYDFQQLADIQLNDGKVSDTVRQSTELELIRAELAELKAKDEYTQTNKQELAAQEAEELAIANYKHDLGKFIGANEKFELLRDEQDASELVFDVIDRHFTDTQKLDAQGNVLTPGELLEMEEVCQYVEDYLKEQDDSYYEKASKRRLPKDDTGKERSSATLSNEHSTIQPTNAPNNGEPMSREESLYKAASMLKYNNDN